MNRRGFFAFVSTCFAAICAAVVAVPGLGYLLSPVLEKFSDKEKDGASGLTSRLCLLSDLKVGKPTEFAVTGTRQDAWTTYPKDQLGRVWLILQSTEAVKPVSETKLDAFTARCPHSGCDIGMHAKKDCFFCPCHNANFEYTGGLVEKTDAGAKNPSPRGMDSLEYQIVQDKKTKAWWVEVNFQVFVTGKEEKIPSA